MAADPLCDITTFENHDLYSSDHECRKNFQLRFRIIYTVPLNSGSLYSATQVIDTYVYRVMTATNNIGMSTAAGLLQNVVGFICIISVNKIVQKIDEDSSLF